MIYEYKANLVRVVDGDTAYFDVDLGFNVRVTLDFRLYGINTPEIIGLTKVAGLAAKAELERLLGLGTVRIVSDKTEKYGRYLATIFVKQADDTELNVNEALVAGGFALPYTGKGPKPT
jgi:micrococcal nuclease